MKSILERLPRAARLRLNKKRIKRRARYYRPVRRRFLRRFMVADTVTVITKPMAAMKRINGNQPEPTAIQSNRLRKNQPEPMSF
ncbi:hypothetical protein PO124_02530 [Bacillus licheniformis]|nr:hypothetical protein [Bacillus licheniformis]